MCPLSRLKQSLLARLINSLMPYIQLCIPYIIIILQHTDLRLIARASQLLHTLQLFIDIMYLTDTAVLTAGVVQNAMPVNFCPHRARSPAEVADVIRSMRNRLHRP